MKVAIAARGDRAESLIDQRFGRCAYFAIYDTEADRLAFVPNTAKDASEGAGPAAVALIAKEGVGKIISGEFGFKIKSMLNDLKIQMVIIKDDKTIAELVAQLKA